MTRADRISRLHQKLLASTDASTSSYRLCGWGSRESRTQRFNALLRSANFKGGLVLDYGCGTGDLYGSLLERGFPFQYLGLDQNMEMIKLARQRYAAAFEHVPLDCVDFGNVDYIFASGIFQFKDDDSPLYYEALLRAFFERCHKAVAVSLLSDQRADSNKDEHELYLSPSIVSSLAASISGQWVLDHSYHPGRGDMTLALVKTSSGALWERPRLPSAP